MYCVKCGAENKETTIFCMECGEKIKITEASESIEKIKIMENVSDNFEESKNYVFEKIKQIGMVTYKSIVTELNIKEDKLYINESSEWFGFIKGKSKNSSFNTNDINSVSFETTWDFWNLLYAIIFLILSVGSGIFWLVIGSGILLYCAYGKKINITTNQNFRVSIAINKNNEDVKEFIELISQEIKQ